MCAARSLPPESHRVAIGGGHTLNATVLGRPDGRPVLLMHSLLTHQAMWGPQAAWLAEKARVIAVDARGHGHSDTPPGEYSFADLVADAIAVLDHFEVPKALVMGLSMGGMTALTMAITHPERVAAMVVCAARADMPAEMQAVWDERIALVRTQGTEAAAQPTLERWFTADTRTTEPGLMADVAAMIAATSIDGFTGCAAALKGLSALPRLGEIRCPTLFVAGAADTGTPPDIHFEMARAMPNAPTEVVVIDGAGHIINLEQPGAFDDAVRPWLESLPDGA